MASCGLGNLLCVSEIITYEEMKMLYITFLYAFISITSVDSWQLLSTFKIHVFFDPVVPLVEIYTPNIFTHIYTFAKSSQGNFIMENNL